MLNETHSTLAPCYPFRYPLLLRWSQKEVIDLLIKGDHLMKISDLIRELQEIQDRDGDIPVNISMNGYENGDCAIISKSDDEFDIYVDESNSTKVLWLDGDSRDLNASIDDGIC